MMRKPIIFYIIIFIVYDTIDVIFLLIISHEY